MAYVVERTLVNGTRFMGMYLDPEGHKRSAGSFSTRREAQRAAHREEQKVLAGAWHDTSLGRSPSRTLSRPSGFPTSTSRPPPGPLTCPT